MPAPDATPLHTYRFDVRWGDMDALGHVNNSRYFTYFEQARVDWMRTLPGGGFSDGTGPVLARTACDFKRPITYPATLHIDVYAGEPGRSSLPTTYDVRDDDGTLYARGEAVIVWVDRATGRPTALPDAVHAALTPQP